MNFWNWKKYCRFVMKQNNTIPFAFGLLTVICMGLFDFCALISESERSFLWGIQYMEVYRDEIWINEDFRLKIFTLSANWTQNDPLRFSKAAWNLQDFQCPPPHSLPKKKLSIPSPQSTKIIYSNIHYSRNYMQHFPHISFYVN